MERGDAGGQRWHAKVMHIVSLDTLMPLLLSVDEAVQLVRAKSASAASDD